MYRIVLKNLFTNCKDQANKTRISYVILFIIRGNPSVIRCPT